MSKRVLVPYGSDSKGQPYLRAARAAKLSPEGVKAKPGLTLDGYGGLLLTGGTDVHPQLYGEAPRPETEEPDEVRDACEMKLIEDALQRDLPIFAICRGHQLLNVFFGGTLIQHLGVPKHEQRPEQQWLPAHKVTVEPGTMLASATGMSTLRVNSRHHQAVGRVGEGLRVSARDPEDGVVEGLELPGKRFVVSVQWHPENQIFDFPEELKLFQAFAEAV
jgi:putative glutamine amidotransferase